MKQTATFMFLVLGTCFGAFPQSQPGTGHPPPVTATHHLPASSPEAQGIPSSAVLGFVEAAESGDALDGFILMRHGQIVAQGWWKPYGPEIPHELYSLSKSFTSTAVGLAVDEGLLNVDAPVLSFFPEEAPAVPSANLAAMRVRHLLSMSTGHAEEPTGRFFETKDSTWVQAFLDAPVAYEPGTHWVYNSSATYMLSAIVQKVTGEKLLDYLQPRLFAPLGIQTPTWDTSPQGINTGGWGLNLTTEDIARLGQLYLQKGLWQGQRLLSEAWIAEATSFHIASDRPDIDWHQGYGYQFWRCRHNAYRGDGAFGQFCLVMPDQDAVLAITSSGCDMQAVLNLVWDRLLPAMQDVALPEDRAGHQKLEAKLGSLQRTLPSGKASSPLAKQVSGRTYTFAQNDEKLESVRLDFSRGSSAVVIRDGSGEHRLEIGYGDWHQGSTDFDSDRQRPYAASGAWTSRDTYAVKICFYTTPWRPTLTFQFGGDLLVYDFEYKASFGPTKRPQHVGRAN